MSSNLDDLLIISCRSARVFAEQAVEHFKSHLEDSKKRYVVHETVKVKSFPDGEIRPEIPANVRKKEVHIFQCFYNLNDGRPPKHMLNEEIKELELTINAAHFAGAKEIIVYLPYTPYMGEDKKDTGRVPQSAQLFFRQLESAGYGDVRRFTCMDLHAKQEVCFANFPIDYLTAVPLLVLRAMQEIKDNNKKHFTLSPDAGGVARVKKISEYTGMHFANAYQTRTDEGKDAYFLAGKIDGEKGIIVDDMVRGAGSLETSKKTALEHGADSIDLGIASHGVLCQGSDGIMANDRLQRMGLKLITTDSIPRSEEYLKQNPHLIVVSVAPMFGGALYANFSGSSVSQIIRDNEEVCKQKIAEIKASYK